MTSVLEALINASERAASVARACCNSSDKEGALLIAEKGSGEANTRFDKDFKTIADVLAQESARFEIAARCPEMAENVRGEECAEIGGVSIGICSTIEDTAQSLSALVPVAAARTLAEAAHCRPLVMMPDSICLPPLDTADLGVWIDPIDATSEFISGAKGESDADHGLSCVTVLIGAYLRSTGEPVMGIINQPFYDKGNGRIFWGACYNDTKECGGIDLGAEPIEPKCLLTSGAESIDIKNKFEEAGWNVATIPGAGHKLLKVALGEATAYLVTKGTTFRWDTCAPHAILRSKGGNVLALDTKIPLTYNDPVGSETQSYANSGGIIAFGEESVLQEVVGILD